MINLVKREDYSSEEEYQQAYKEMCEAIDKHNKMHLSDGYDPTTVEKLRNKILNGKH